MIRQGERGLMKMNDDADLEEPPAIAALHHLTGPSRGRASWLSLAQHDVILKPTGEIRIVGEPDGGPAPTCRARFRRTGGTYLVEPCGGETIWVNRAPAKEQQLSHRDVIEFGEDGPLSRFEIIDETRPLHRPIPEIFKDALAYFRISRRPFPRRVLTALSQLASELALRTTVLFRITIIVAVLAIAAIAWQQSRLIRGLEETVAAGQQRLDAVAAALAVAREEALGPDDLALLRQDVGRQFTAQVKRLEELEQRWQAGAHIVARSSSSVVFLQCGFGLRDQASGRMLRKVVDENGKPLIGPTGNPLLSLEGKGPVAERHIVGTGFFIAGSGMLATNRHVVFPWEHDAAAKAAAIVGLEPVMLKLIAYIPGEPEPVEIALEAVSDDADLALLAVKGEAPAVPGLEIAKDPPAVGEDVIAMGYPAGLRSMLAQSGVAFIKSLQETEEIGFWQISAQLAKAGYIKPLASRGIVAQMTPSALVFDAETTHGASGGPVLDSHGRVIAIQSAILPEYGGSNLAVPASELQKLLKGKPVN